MSVEVVVARAVLAAVGAALDGIGSATSGAAGMVRSAGGPVEPAMSAGVDAVVTSWGGAVELLAASTGVLGELVARAAAGYVAADDAVGRGFDADPA